MNEIYNDETLSAFLATDPETELLALVERLVARARAQNLWKDLTCIVVQPEGTEPVEWDWRVEHGDWLELGKTAGNSGFAWIVLGRRRG